MHLNRDKVLRTARYLQEKEGEVDISSVATVLDVPPRRVMSFFPNDRALARALAKEQETE